MVLSSSDQTFLPTTTLIGDLGAESIDFLDITCELEKLVDKEVDFRKLLVAKRIKSQGGVIDLTLEDLVKYLRD